MGKNKTLELVWGFSLSWQTRMHGEGLNCLEEKFEEFVICHGLLTLDKGQPEVA